MNRQEILNNKNIKLKTKTRNIAKWLIENPKKISDLITFAKKSKDPIKATCIEAIEFATKTNPKIANPICLKFVYSNLNEKTPRVKWESAKVIGNIAHLYPGKLNTAIAHLLTNTEHTGTVVRWSAAFALAEIIKLKTKLNKALVPAAESIIKREEKKQHQKNLSGGSQKNRLCLID